MTVVETQRLTLVPYAASDIDALHRLWTDADVRKFLWDDRVISHEEASAVVLASIADWIERGYGQWTIRLRGSDEIVGFCGFRPASWGDAPEILCGIHPRHGRQGLATEAVRAALLFGFERLAFGRVVSATDPPNVASQRLMRRSGMSYEGRGSLNGLDVVFFQITREAFGALGAEGSVAA